MILPIFRHRSLETVLLLKPAPAKSQLMKPRAAISRLQYLLGGSRATKETLADLMKDGELPVYARYYWIARAELADAANLSPPSTAHEKVKVPTRRFRASKAWQKDIAEWNWKGRVFAFRLKKAGTKIAIMRSIRFSSDDIEKIAEEALTARHKTKKNSGQKKNLERFYHIWIAAGRLSTRVPFTRDYFHKKEAFLRSCREVVIQDFGEKPFSLQHLRNEWQDLIWEYMPQSTSALSWEATKVVKDAQDAA